MIKYRLSQLDGEDCLIEVNFFSSIPTLAEFSDVAYHVDREDIKKVYNELINCIGDWVFSHAVDEDGFSEFYVDEGVWFLLEEYEDRE